MDRIGVLDLGTNTFRLLIAGRTANHPRERNLMDRRVVRIGEGFVRSMRISIPSVKRGIKVLKEFASQLKRHGVDRVLSVATGVFREAGNAAEVIEEIEASCRFPIRVLTASEEGTYTLKGVRAGMNLSGTREALIVDIGGGSTEFVRTGPSGKDRVLSIPAGAVYLKERFEPSASSEPKAFSAMQQWIENTLEGVLSNVSDSDAMTCIGTGGSITTLSYMVMGLRRYDPARIHGALLTLDEVDRLLAEVRTGSCRMIQERFHLETGRADLVLYGGALTQGILRRLPSRSLTVSDYGLLEGLALEMLEDRKGDAAPGDTGRD